MTGKESDAGMSPTLGSVKSQLPFLAHAKRIIQSHTEMNSLSTTIRDIPRVQSSFRNEQVEKLGQTRINDFFSEREVLSRITRVLTN